MKEAAGKHVAVGLLIAVVVLAVVGGLVLSGSPTEERLRRLDARRVEDLRGIAAAMDLYWTRHGRLAASLNELAREGGVSLSSRDPTTDESYGYRARSDTTYDLCARFERESTTAEGFWSHGAGGRCFRLDTRDVRRGSPPHRNP